MPAPNMKNTNENIVDHTCTVVNAKVRPIKTITQARRCFHIICQALEDLGGGIEDIVRTRMFIVDPADADVVGAVHGELFRDIRPAATMVVVAKLLRPEWRIEIEAEALVGDETA